MGLRPKTRRRLTLAGVAAGLLVVAVFAGVYVRSWQARRTIDRLRSEGLAAYQAGDFPAALETLGRYVRRVGERPGGQPDQDALLALARARLKIEEPGGEHVSQAFKLLRWAHNARPDDKPLALEVATLANRLTLYDDARTAAARARPDDLAACTPADVPSLREEIVAVIGLSPADARAEQLLARAIELAPGDLTLHARYIGWLGRNDRADDAARHAARWRDERRDDPRFAVLGLLAPGEGSAPPREELFATLCTLAGLDVSTAEPAPGAAAPPDDREFTTILVRGFLSLGSPRHAAGVLRAAAASTRDPRERAEWSAALARRAWQHGLVEPAIALASTPDAASLPPDALAHAALLTPDGASTPDAESLLAVRTDPLSRLWGDALAAVRTAQNDRSPGSLVNSLKALRAAEQALPDEPVFPYIAGQLLVATGREDEARAAFARAQRTPFASSWGAPLLRTAESLLRSGRPGEAADAARRSLAVEPSVPALTTAVLAACAGVEAGHAVPWSAEELLDFGGQSLRAAQGTPIEPELRDALAAARARLLALSGQTDDARRELARAIAACRGDHTRTLRLAEVSADLGLGLESAVLRQIDAADAPPTTPDAVLSRAVLLARSGRTDDAARAVDLIAPTDRPLVVARLAQRLGDPDEHALWTDAADAFPKRMDVQLGALASTAAVDPRTADRLTARLNALQGEGAAAATLTPVRLARARALLAGPPSPRARDEALAILRSLRIEEPRWPAPRDLLVRALLWSDPTTGLEPDTTGAIGELRALQPLLMDAGGVRLRIADLFAAQRDWSQARAELSGTLIDASIPARTRVDAAVRLVALGDAESALAGLRSIEAIESPVSARTRAVLSVALAATTGDVPPPASIPSAEDLAAARVLAPDDPALAWARLRRSLLGDEVINPRASDALGRTAHALATLDPDEAVDLLSLFGRRHAGEPGAMALTVDLMLRMDPPRPDACVPLLASADDAGTLDPAHAKARVLVDGGAGRWADALAAARRWLEADPDSDNAAAAVARTAARADLANEAAVAIEPRLPRASARVRAAYASATIAAGRSDEALARLAGTAASANADEDGEWAGVIAEATDAQVAQRWLDAVAARADQRGSIALAVAALDAAQTFPASRVAFFERAAALLAPLTPSAPTDEPVGLRAMAAAVLLAPLSLDAGQTDAGERLVGVALASGSFETAHVLGVRLALTAESADADVRPALLAAAKRAFAVAAASPEADARPRLALADVHGKLNEHADAAGIYRAFLARYPLPPGVSRPALLNNLAFELARSTTDPGALEEARTLSDRAIAALPKSADPRLRAAFHLTAATIREARSDRPGTEQALAAAHRLTPSDPAVVLRLAAFLAGGTEPQRAEAARLLDALDPAAAGDQRVAEVRERLGSNTR
jgi:tetratricopeptide (TPR) repeat protein